jgi:kumamolisin
MSSQDRSNLQPSERADPPDPRAGDIDPDERATVTVFVRRRAALPTDGTRLSRSELAAAHGAADDDIAAVADFAASSGLEVGEVDAARASVQLSGRLGDLTAAFGTSLAVYETTDGTRYRGRSGQLSLPTGLAEVVTGVFGLDERPQAAPRLRRRAGASSDVAYSPVQVAAAYDFPSSATGSGQTVALIELGGGYRSADLAAYFESLGVAVPTVTAVPVDGGANSPGTAGGPDGEVMLDIEVVGAVAPGARIAVYFAPNTDQGFIDAVTTAIHDTTNTPSVVSISWGGAESTWTSAAMTQMEDAFAAAATAGVTVTVAAGDNGSTDGQTDGLQHVDFPASAPHALACGGTSLRIGGGGAITSEVVWNDQAAGDGATGGGVSTQFPLPSYQAGAGVPVSANPGGAAGRGVPDVAGDADPATGYTIRVDGSTETIGGTSAVAPLWAALVARLNQGLGRDVGFLQPQLYALAEKPPSTGAVVNDITSGDNGAYRAGPGWDPCTGLGSPRGQNLLTALQSLAPALSPAPRPTPTP